MFFMPKSVNGVTFFELVFFLLFLLVILSPPSVNAFPVQEQNKFGLVKQGQGQMNILFWSVYRAEYFIEQQKNADQQLKKQSSSGIQALKLTYLRDITNTELIDATDAQWQHLALELPKKKQWLSQLQLIWPNINESDTLTLLVDENEVSHFYLSNKEHRFVKKGQINDAEFSKAFLAIWLSENTSRPELRKQLLGMNL